MKAFMRYILIFFITLFILLSLLVVTAKIPRSAIQQNIKESTKIFKNNLEIYRLDYKRDYTYLHPYADAMLVNIIYCIDTNCPLEAVIEAKYHCRLFEKFISYNFEAMVEGEWEGNQEYLRYWHGQMAILRPLLVFFDLGQIYIINIIAFWILTIILIIILIKKKYINLLIGFLIAFIMCTIPIVPLCLEYSTTFYIMLLSTIIAIYIKDDNKKLENTIIIKNVIDIV